MGPCRDAAGCARGSSRPWYARKRPWRSLLNGRSFGRRRDDAAICCRTGPWRPRRRRRDTPNRRRDLGATEGALIFVRPISRRPPGRRWVPHRALEAQRLRDSGLRRSRSNTGHVRFPGGHGPPVQVAAEPAAAADERHSRRSSECSCRDASGLRSVVSRVRRSRPNSSSSRRSASTLSTPTSGRAGLRRGCRGPNSDSAAGFAREIANEAATTLGLHTPPVHSGQRRERSCVRRPGGISSPIDIARYTAGAVVVANPGAAASPLRSHERRSRRSRRSGSMFPHKTLVPSLSAHRRPRHRVPMSATAN